MFAILLHSFLNHLSTEVYRERRETYQKFVDLILDHIGKTKLIPMLIFEKRFILFTKRVYLMPLLS